MNSTGIKASPTAPEVGSRTPWQKHKLLAIVIAAALLAGGLLTWVLLHNRVSPASAETVSAAKFVSTADFEKLPQEQKSPYLQTLEKSKAQLAAAYQLGQISDPEYQKALQYAWVARLEKQMDQYFAIADPAKRVKFLDKIINQRQAAKAGLSESSKGHSGFLRKRLKSWPPEMQQHWEQFRKAVQERRRARGLPPDPHMQVTLASQ